jgi:hypothetical protein
MYSIEARWRLTRSRTGKPDELLACHSLKWQKGDCGSRSVWVLHYAHETYSLNELPLRWNMHQRRGWNSSMWHFVTVPSHLVVTGGLIDLYVLHADCHCLILV